MDPNPYDWCPYKKRKLGPRHARVQKEDHVRTLGEGDHLPAKVVTSLPEAIPIHVSPSWLTWNPGHCAFPRVISPSSFLPHPHPQRLEPRWATSVLWGSEADSVPGKEMSYKGVWSEPSIPGCAELIVPTVASRQQMQTVKLPVHHHNLQASFFSRNPLILLSIGLEMRIGDLLQGGSKCQSLPLRKSQCNPQVLQTMARANHSKILAMCTSVRSQALNRELCDKQEGWGL